jgi:hypothetical protein
MISDNCKREVAGFFMVYRCLKMGVPRYLTTRGVWFDEIIGPWLVAFERELKQNTAGTVTEIEGSGVFGSGGVVAGQGQEELVRHFLCRQIVSQGETKIKQCGKLPQHGKHRFYSSDSDTVRWTCIMATNTGGQNNRI